jgi:RHS repeat-associated protein
MDETASGVASGSWGLQHAYDGFGNLAVTGPSLELATPTNVNQYDVTNNRLQKDSSGVALPSDAYDGSGNLQHHPNMAGVMSYDAENRLRSMGTETFVYDGEGRRVQKAGPNGTTTFVYDAQGNLAAEYGYGPAPLCAPCYLTADPLGSTRLVTDSAGIVKQRRDFQPFGGEIPANATFGNRQVVTDGGSGTTYAGAADPAVKFTGQVRDAETGLDYFGARYFSAALGRFATADRPIVDQHAEDPQSWNLYSYVRNRPLALVDKNGTWATPIHADIVRFAVGSYVSAPELQHLISRQYIMDQDQSPRFQYMHAMSNGAANQSTADAANLMWSWVAWNVQDANANLANGSFSDLSLVRLGDAMHTLQDYTSPMHTISGGDLIPWYGVGFLGLRGATHWAGESSPDRDWGAIGYAIRLTMAALLQSGASCEQGRVCLNAANFESEVNKNISQYVNSFYAQPINGNQPRWKEDAARQCALGNPAACDR